MSDKRNVVELNDETRSRLERARERALGGRWRGRDREVRIRRTPRVLVWRPDPKPPTAGALKRPA